MAHNYRLYVVTSLTVLVATLVLSRFFPLKHPLLFTTTSKNYAKLLLVSFDGTRYDYVDRSPNLPAFRYLRENGVKAKYVKPPFPTLTLPSHFTMATGLYPESHGVVLNCHYNISTGEAHTRNYMDTLGVNSWWDTGAEPIWATAVKQGLRSGGYLFPGSDLSSGGFSATKKMKKVKEELDESVVYQQIDEIIRWFTEDKLDMIAVYFDEPDLHGHKHGPDSQEIFDQSLPLINRTIMYLLDKVEEAGLKEDLNIIITSDHGHQGLNLSVTNEEAISLKKYVDHRYIDFSFYYGALGLIEPKPKFVDHVYRQLKDANPNMKVYRKEDIPERLHYKNNPRIPSIVVIANPGYQVYGEFPGYHIMKSDHGYDNDNPNMWAFYYSVGPSFKKNHVIEGFESIHLYPLMCHLLGITPAPNNGSLEVLIDTLL